MRKKKVSISWFAIIAIILALIVGWSYIILKEIFIEMKYIITGGKNDKSGRKEHNKTNGSN
jgi:hypothetical protein